jgi:twinkle protein
MHLIRDDIDLNAYTDRSFHAKVRPAFEFGAELRKSLAPPAMRPVHPSMVSTKLRKVLQFRPGETTVWAGFSKHRKSIFLGQVQLDLCVQGRRVLIASFEMPPADTIARIARQALGTDQPSAEQLERFLRWTDNRLWLFDHVGRFDPEKACALTRYFADQHQGTDIVLDSMMMIVATEDRNDEQKQFATDIVRTAQETRVHAHVVAHCRKPASGDESRPPTKYDVRGSSAITDQAHNIVTVWANKAKKATLEADALDERALAKPDALISVEGQRNGAFEGKVALWFDERSMRFCDDRITAVSPYRLDEPLVRATVSAQEEQ